MVRRAGTAVLCVLALGAASCGDKGDEERATVQATSPTPAKPKPRAVPPAPRGAEPDAVRKRLLELVVPEGVPTRGDGEPANANDVAVVQRWLSALTHGDIRGAADTFVDGTRIQNLRPPSRLADLGERLAFNAGFPCGAELVEASSVRGYVVVTYRLTDRVGSRCDGPGGRAAGTIKVEGGHITEWYRLPDPPQAPSAEPGPVI